MSATPPISAPKGLRILHLEDDLNDRDLIRQRLQDEGLAAAIVAVAKQADFVAVLEGQPFDIVLSDKSLPGFDGLTALRLTRERFPHLPFVFVTGSMGDESAAETIKLGATDYVLKDRLSGLVPALERAMRESAQAEKGKRAEEKIHEQAAWLDKARDAIIVPGLDQKIRYWNKSAERLYGWTTAEAMGREADKLLFRGKSEGGEAAARIILENDEWCGELRQVTKAGGEVIVESRWNLVRDKAGRPDSILMVNTDITARKALETQFLRVQRLESIGALASGIAHDLNNVLSPILMGVACLKDQISDPSSLEILNTIETSATRGAGVVKQVVTFARSASGERVALQPNYLITEIVKIIRETFPKSIRVNADCAPGLWTMEGEPSQIHQMLLTLCLRARDAMPEGGVLTITSGNVTLTQPPAYAGLSGAPGPYVRIEVKDSGTQVASGFPGKSVLPAFTGEASGLGWSAIVAILGSHRGLLDVQSAPGKGTIFGLYFPSVAVPQEEGTTTEVQRRRAGRQDLILLVDDEAAIREMCRFMLESCNYRVVTAENGAQALALFEKHREELALVVTDSNMPVMGGSTAARAMRWAAPHLKIISASGGEPNEEDVRAADPKLHRFLAKPYTAEQLLHLIGELLPTSLL